MQPHRPPTPAQTADELLRRSLLKGRLGHAYLFVGEDLGRLETAAVHLAQTVNCIEPTVLGEGGLAAEPCGRCRCCLQIAQQRHPDITWVRPENRIRAISVTQIREVIRVLSLRPSEARRKVAILAGADRLNVQAANAFLKTLEEPPSGAVLILLSTDPDRLLETILSRCLRLSFASGIVSVGVEVARWVREFAELAKSESPDLMRRYQLLITLLQTLAAARTAIETRLEEASPLKRHPDAEPETRERWEDELTAAVEAEYRRHRGEFLSGLLAWLRDIWILTEHGGAHQAFLPQFAEATTAVARRISAQDARQNLLVIERTIRRLYTNAQEALVLEVGLLQLTL